MEIIAKSGNLSLKHMTGTKSDGKAYDFYGIEKNYKDQSGNWKKDELIINPSDMAALAYVSQEGAHYAVVQQAQAANERIAARKTANDDDFPA